MCAFIRNWSALLTVATILRPALAAQVPVGIPVQHGFFIPVVNATLNNTRNVNTSFNNGNRASYGWSVPVQNPAVAPSAPIISNSNPYPMAPMANQAVYNAVPYQTPIISPPYNFNSGNNQNAATYNYNAFNTRQQGPSDVTFGSRKPYDKLLFNTIVYQKVS